MHKTTHPCGATHPPPQNDVVSIPIPIIPSLQPYRNNHDPLHHRNRLISQPFIVTTTVTAAVSSWLRNRRIRYLFLFLFSPLLLVLLLISLPFLCAAEVCLRGRFWRKLFRDSEDGSDRLRWCDEGCCGGEEEKGLLHRYLEDQLFLVGSMYDCGNKNDEDEQEEEYDSRRIQDIENLGSSSRIPLLR
ncbi:hypothetical protein TanjilG_08150 [Lupinus angustifolius]|uniref:Transmembrane protein n=1 Tax=Lupinus angustifolius TaxID=3871 RepID=A0A4P1RLD3_LUPAN|nr:PREDICTED: uncharacterized protein LOC109346159 [Lupinus angustifolius]OIW13117.1 hypothetical protein TanjilG_08150 [Lupinus angustifolius]